jgi:hypothetical protein
LVEGGRYAWRVTAFDGTGSSGWTSLCEFSVYMTVPPVEGCQSGVAGDFNGDGVADRVIGDPKATVSSLSNAGAVYLIDGATGAERTLQQGLDGVPDAAEANDRFGSALAVFDANHDGCADLAVGSPFEDVGTTADAGAVYLLYGAPAGLGKGPAALTIQQGADLSAQGRGTVPDTPEANDWFGYSVAGGATAAGEEYLIIGAPGEDAGSVSDAGTVHYLRNAIDVKFDGQSPQGTETDDREGFAVAASPYQFAIGIPGEQAGTSTQQSGAVCVLNHNSGATPPAGIRCLVQGDDTNTSEKPERGDWFGKSIAMVPYRPVGAVAGVADSLLAVGAPGEDVGTIADAGRVQQFLVTPTGATQLTALDQGSTGISGNSESGDFFGEKVVLVNTNPAAEASPSTVLIAVGAPGEDLSALDAGEVRVFAAGTTTVTDTTVYRKTGALPGTPMRAELIGAWLTSDGMNLLVSVPYGSKAVYAVPWTNLAAGNPAPTVTYQPGQGGLPSSTGSFGLAVG